MKGPLMAGAVAGCFFAMAPLGTSTNPFAVGAHIYRGSSDGVSMTLTIPLSSRVRPRLTVKFTGHGDALWRRVLAVGKLEAFCGWDGPAQTETGSNTVDIALDSTHQTQTFGIDPSRSGRSYTCGLHVRTEGLSPGQTWNQYVRQAPIAVRLALRRR